MTPDEFDSMVLDAINMVGEDRFDEAISISKEALKFEDCDEDPNSRIWPAGTIVAAYLFKYKENTIYPGSDAYENIKKYTKITLDAFGDLHPEVQANYKKSHPKLFPLLRPILEITQAGKLLNEPQAPSPKKSGCFVATAIYGSYNDSNVVVLRRYRDSNLLITPLGKALVSLYYWVSPPIAIVLEKIPLLRDLIRKLILQPIVDRLLSDNR